MEKKYCVYVYLNPLKKGVFKYFSFELDFEPFYVGKGLVGSKRKTNHLHYVKNLNKDLTNNKYKYNIIKQILNSDVDPIIIELVSGLTESDAFKLEEDLINLIGFRYNNTGLLTNISKGGLGSDTFTNNPNKEIIREKHRQNAIGSKNNRYGLPLDSNPSHLSKLNGNHWNKNRKHSKESKINMSKNGHLSFKKVVKVDNEGVDIEMYQSLNEARDKNNIKYSSAISRACIHGGRAGGFKWRYENIDLVKPKEKLKIKKVIILKKIFFKEELNSNIEIEFDSVIEASLKMNLCVETIRRKCRSNNSHENIFRYENDNYKFNVKSGNKRKICMIDKIGNKTTFVSITEAAEIIKGKTSSIFAVCSGRNKFYRGLKFEYIN